MLGGVAVPCRARWCCARKGRKGKGKEGKGRKGKGKGKGKGRKEKEREGNLMDPNES